MKTIDKEKKVNYSQNLGVVEEEAKKSFLELIDEIKTAKEDNREENLLSSKKAKVYEYYLVFTRESKPFKNYLLIAYMAVVVFLNFDKELLRITDNYILDSGIQGAVLFLFFSFFLIHLQSKYNLRNFFLRMYPQIQSEKNLNLISEKMGNFLFTSFQLKEHGYKKIVFLFFILIFADAIIILNDKFMNLNILGFGVFCVFLMMQRRENNVTKFI